MMKNRNILKPYIGVLLFISGLNLNAQNSFIQNKGQLPKQVEAKVNLPSGALFIENGKLIFSFYSADQLVAAHNLSSTIKEIDAHAYSMEFVNSNIDISTELLEESRYFENYFLAEKSKFLGCSKYRQIR